MSNRDIAISVVSKITKVPKSKILSDSRKFPAVEARMLIVMLLSSEGYTDIEISWGLNRKRGAILKSRHNALNLLAVSKPFRDKYNSAKDAYHEQKSLRLS